MAWKLQARECRQVRKCGYISDFVRALGCPLVTAQSQFRDSPAFYMDAGPAFHADLFTAAPLKQDIAIGQFAARRCNVRFRKANQGAAVVHQPGRVAGVGYVPAVGARAEVQCLRFVARIRFGKAHMQCVAARVPAAEARDPDEIRAGGDILGNPEVRALPAVVVAGQLRAAGVLQPPERVGAAAGVGLQRARAAHLDAEVIRVAGDQRARRV